MAEQTTMIQTQIPKQLLVEARSLVESGWFGSVDEIIVNALRRFASPTRTTL